MTSASPPPPAPAPPPRPGRTGLALGLIGAGVGLVALLGWLAYRTPAPALAPTDPVQAIAAELVGKLNTGLPRDIGDGLVLERMAVEGRTIVMTMRSPRMTLAEAARDPALVNMVRDDETARLLTLCASPEFRLVLDEGVVITRRFTDRDGRRFFDISVAAADCRQRR